MIERFRPDEYVASVSDIDFDALWGKGIRGLMFDIDNTLMLFDTDTVPVPVKEMFARLKEKGFTVWLLSNGRSERVESIKKQLQVEGTSRAAKPLMFGYKRLLKQAPDLKGKVAVIGDQVFMDAHLARRSNSYGILVRPISLEHDEKQVKARRKAEARIIRKLGIVPKKLAASKDRRADMRIDGNTTLFGVIGDPIGHTLSPVIHQILIDHINENYAYIALHVKKEGLEDFIKGAYAAHIAGINVTIPHKQAVMKLCCRIDPSAQLVGAVNTLKWTPEGYVGYNTDVDGFSHLVQLAKVPVKGHKVLILGAGGAAHSAVAVSYLMGASEIVIFNRTQDKAKALVKEFQDRIRQRGDKDTRLRTVSADNLVKEEFTIVFNTTSAGMAPNVDTLPVSLAEGEEAFYSQIRFALDMVFNPSETAFMKKVRQSRGTAVGGLSMLFYQGIRSFEIWTGKKFTYQESESMFRSFMERAENCV